MLLKPSLDDLPVEKELKEELDINTKKKYKQAIRVFGLILFN